MVVIPWMCSLILKFRPNVRMRRNNKGRPHITIELMMSLPDVTSDDIMVQGAGIDNVMMQ